ncbi:uncharacterized protein TRAVEDRAFT_33747 [Trametes versicolor FP-101664 SS1]|uniref:uncharacterized protein n=1 Tax=Trametes versicolor (strain FP-101664) TaxID=717944 RepID=UPI0004621D8F|nr:uncharacterized protein TRAVEDRAFT_33747 [Trametes versicolor FP-101664 SS1]EIW65092.1 hypothetical protein TRAVEDRAFT_33747 [Trametes versicolor FP-101664 SS1]
MMADLERILTGKGIPFHRDGNRLRCFPHVVNISVQHGLSSLTDLDPFEPTATADESTNDIPTPDQTIVNARQLISVCRVSGQRREEFKNTIIEGNKAGSFGEGVELPKAQLLRDVDTRWSSTFLMIDRLLELYPAVQNFMKKPDYEELAHHLLSEKELDVLADVRGFLLIPHRVQELLSAEQTPTASMTLPAYEELLELLKLARSKYSKIAHGIEASISVLEQYLRYTRQTRVYALAMGMSTLYFQSYC